MRLLIPVMLAVLTGCGSPPDSGDTSMERKDSVMTADNTSTPAPNSLAPAEQGEGWQLLFDGSTKSNFHSYNNKSDGSAWKVVDGTLHLDTTVTAGGDIVSNDEYGNFHLQADWKIGSGGNSGILFYVKEDPKYGETYHTGPEMQALDNELHGDAKIIKHRAGDLYDLITSSPEVVQPAGEWNHIDIISNNGSLEFRLNGSSVVKTNLWDDNWKKLVAGSKFKQWADFGTFKTGHIAFQDHGNSVWYRNIKIRKL